MPTVPACLSKKVHVLSAVIKDRYSLPSTFLSSVSFQKHICLGIILIPKIHQNLMQRWKPICYFNEMPNIDSELHSNPISCAVIFSSNRIV